jgi:short-subunit dehydrogenase
MNIVVTGASRGIGRAILEAFAQRGWNLMFCSVHLDSVTKTKQYLSDKYPDVSVYGSVCDMSSKEQVTSFGLECIEKLGRIDVLVNNAGKYTPGSISDANFDDDLEGLMKLNVYSAYWLGKILIPHMVSHQSGHIFNMSSIAGLEAYPNGGSYAITKFAMQGYSKTLREELKNKNIRVTALYPGATYTDSWAGSDLPEDRFMKVEDIAELIFSISQLSIQSVVEEMVIRPQLGDI